MFILRQVAVHEAYGQTSIRIDEFMDPGEGDPELLGKVVAKRLVELERAQPDQPDREGDGQFGVPGFHQAGEQTAEEHQGIARQQVHVPSRALPAHALRGLAGVLPVAAAREGQAVLVDVQIAAFQFEVAAQYGRAQLRTGTFTAVNCRCFTL